MHFISIQVRENNLMYLFFDDALAFSVDAYNPDAVVHALSCEFSKQRYTEKEIMGLPGTRKPRVLSHTLTTHRHRDHSGGNARLAEISPDTAFIFSATTGPYTNISIRPYQITCIPTPCHTTCSFTYLVEADLSAGTDMHIEGEVYRSRHYLITGDFLFRLGCGKFFEGDSRTFLSSLSNILNRSPDSAILLYGHDYREDFARFASQFYRPAPTGYWLTLAEEKEYNPFINYRKTGIAGTAEEAVQKLRDMRDASC